MFKWTNEMTGAPGAEERDALVKKVRKLGKEWLAGENRTGRAGPSSYRFWDLKSSRPHECPRFLQSLTAKLDLPRKGCTMVPKMEAFEAKTLSGEKA